MGCPGCKGSCRGKPSSSSLIGRFERDESQIPKPTDWLEVGMRVRTPLGEGEVIEVRYRDAKILVGEEEIIFEVRFLETAEQE